MHAVWEDSFPTRGSPPRGRWAAVTGLPRSLPSSEGRSRVPGRPTRPGLTCPAHLGFSPCPPASPTLRPHAPTAHSLMPFPQRGLRSEPPAPASSPPVPASLRTLPPSSPASSAKDCSPGRGRGPSTPTFCCRPLPQLRPPPRLIERRSCPCLGWSEAPP